MSETIKDFEVSSSPNGETNVYNYTEKEPLVFPSEAIALTYIEKYYSK